MTDHTPNMFVLPFLCRPQAVGHLVGRHWAYIDDLCARYAEQFHNATISVTYDGAWFLVRVQGGPSIKFVEREFGKKVAIANDGIVAEPAGAIIGKDGWWLRKTEREQAVECIIYHEEGVFYVKFPPHVTTKDRFCVLDNVRRKIIGRANYFANEFSN